MKKTDVTQTWSEENLPRHRKACPPVHMRVVSVKGKGKANDQYILWVNWEKSFDSKNVQEVLESPTVSRIYKEHSRQRTGTWLVLAYPHVSGVGVIVYHEGPDDEDDYDRCVSWYNIMNKALQDQTHQRKRKKSRAKARSEEPIVLTTHQDHDPMMMPFYASFQQA